MKTIIEELADLGGAAMLDTLILAIDCGLTINRETLVKFRATFN